MGTPSELLAVAPPKLSRPFLVTGSSSGVGRAAAQTLSSQSRFVCVVPQGAQLGRRTLPVLRLARRLRPGTASRSRAIRSGKCPVLHSVSRPGVACRRRGRSSMRGRGGAPSASHAAGLRGDVRRQHAVALSDRRRARGSSCPAASRAAARERDLERRLRQPTRRCRLSRSQLESACVRRPAGLRRLQGVQRPTCRRAPAPSRIRTTASTIIS